MWFVSVWNSYSNFHCDKNERAPGKVPTKLFTQKSHLKILNLNSPRYQISNSEKGLHTFLSPVCLSSPLVFAYLDNKLLIYKFSWLGYLLDEPNALEFEDEEEELTADTDESESASVSNSDSEDDKSSDEITLGDLLQSGDIANDDNDEDEDEESGDDDWDPSKDNPKRRKQTKKEQKKKKKKSKTEDSDERNDAITSNNFQQTERTSQNEDGDNDNEPEKQIKSEPKKETKRRKTKRKKLETESPTVENGLTHPLKLKKKANKTQLKSPDNDNDVETTETVNSPQNNKVSENIHSTPVNSLNSVKTNSSKKNEGKTQNQVGLQETSPEKRNNQSQLNEVRIQTSW